MALLVHYFASADDEWAVAFGIDCHVAVVLVESKMPTYLVELLVVAFVAANDVAVGVDSSYTGS